MGSENKICFLFQSTHPRRVWHYGNDRCKSSREVSIHTPTKGVTKYYSYISAHQHVSIHTPTKGVTRGSPAPSNKVIVSIHTPTKGVTEEPLLNLGLGVFQSTHSRRVWRVPMLRHCEKLRFQSTHPRRVWPTDFANFCATSQFQSTHPRRVWLALINI